MSRFVSKILFGCPCLKEEKNGNTLNPGPKSYFNSVPGGRGGCIKGGVVGGEEEMLMEEVFMEEEHQYVLVVMMLLTLHIVQFCYYIKDCLFHGSNINYNLYYQPILIQK